MRLVLDTNVLIAAYISRGLCSEVLETCLKKHELVLSGFLADELTENLIHKFYQPKEEVQDYLHVLSLHADWVQPLPLNRKVSRDPNDDMVLATALAGRADYLVTGDKDLLSLKKFNHVQIFTPRLFWEKVASKDEAEGE